jgi:peptidoglycan/xylan/chitin deacetylase (PgdA/CDA1 family)/glycosyltransferase involved in cell wall biosynthesis
MIPMLSSLIRTLSHGKLTVLLFHKVPHQAHPLTTGELDLAGFERVLLSTMRVFRVIPLEDALVGLRQGTLPPRAACITFDDGYPDWLTGVVPVLEREGAHATFFITSGQFAGLPMWHERILHAVAGAPEGVPPLQLDEVVSPAIVIGEGSERRQAVRHLDELVKYQPPALKERLLQQLEAHTHAEVGNVPVMTTDSLRALHARGFGIGGHAVSHPILRLCTPDEAYGEIAGAREELESIIRAPVRAFAYPNGVPGRDFTDEHVAMVRRAGYTSAVTTHSGAATASTSAFQIPRFTPWGPSALRRDLQFARNLTQRPRALAQVPQDNRKLLMVAFHFPPQAGSSGILRTLNFAKNLPGSGWQPIVLSAHPRAYEERRDDLLKDIPPDIKVVRAFAMDAAKHLSIQRKYPGFLALPDRWSSWCPDAVRAGLDEIRQEGVSVIWSTYPIASAHLIGFLLQKYSGLPWVADFRDPMLNGDYPSQALQRRVWGWLEPLVFRHATRCVFTTERAAELYRSRYPHAAAKCMVIENGYDEDAFVDNFPTREGVAPGELLILHSGIIYPKDRNPDQFFAALARLVQQPAWQGRRVRVRFRAPVHGGEVAALARQHGVDAIVEIAPPIPYRQAIAEMMGADLLLVFQGSQFNTQIPAKIYEYLRTGRPVVGLVDKTGDTARQLRKFEGVALADMSDADDIEGVLGHWFAQPGGQDASQAFNRTAILAYSRKAQAVALARTLTDAAGAAAQRTPLAAGSGGSIASVSTESTGRHELPRQD